MIRTKWTRLAGLCALLTLALPGAGALSGHYDLALQHSDVELRQHALELNFLSILCLIFVLLYLRSERPAVQVPVYREAGYVTVEPGPPVFAVHPRLQPCRGPPA